MRELAPATIPSGKSCLEIMLLAPAKLDVLVGEEETQNRHGKEDLHRLELRRILKGCPWVWG